MKKKMRLKVLLSSTATALLLLSGCQSNQTDQTVATYSGGKVTESSLYKELKQSPTTKTMLANMLIYRALNHAYGKSVSTKTVNDAMACCFLKKMKACSPLNQCRSNIAVRGQWWFLFTEAKNTS